MSREHGAPTLPHSENSKGDRFSGQRQHTQPQMLLALYFLLCLLVTNQAGVKQEAHRHIFPFRYAVSRELGITHGAVE